MKEYYTINDVAMMSGSFIGGLLYQVSIYM